MNNMQTDVVSYLLSQGITKLYHFTDKSNIPSIISNGGLFSWKACEKKGITINKPGGNDASHSLDFYRGLENYVRLSFTQRHPMMYLAQKDGRISNPVVLEIDLAVAGLITTLFADRNATKTDAVITAGYNGAKNIHFSTVRQSTHFNLSPEEKEFYQAEVLVLESVPLTCITNIDDFRPKPHTPTATPSVAATSSKTTSSKSQSTAQTPLPWSPSLPWSASAIDKLIKKTQESTQSNTDLIKDIEAQNKKQERILEEARRIQAQKDAEDKKKARLILLGFLIGAIITIIGVIGAFSS